MPCKPRTDISRPLLNAVKTSPKHSLHNTNVIDITVQTIHLPKTINPFNDPVLFDSVGVSYFSCCCWIRCVSNWRRCCCCAWIPNIVIPCIVYFSDISWIFVLISTYHAIVWEKNEKLSSTYQLLQGIRKVTYVQIYSPQCNRYPIFCYIIANLLCVSIHCSTYTLTHL